MKIVALSDIHQWIPKWKELVKICEEDHPDVVLIAGDLFPKDCGILGQQPFIKHMRKYAEQIQNAGSKLVMMMGNDDNQLMIPDMEEGEKDGLWINIANKCVEIDGQEFCGMPYVPDYPFGYKFWCHPEFDDELRICPARDRIVINKDNEFEDIENFLEYMLSKISIWDALLAVEKDCKHIDKSIWLIHAPPADMLLDLCASGEKVGSKAVWSFISKYQPFITIHGHIHESPEYNGHKWKDQCGGTLCIQGGQLGRDLHYSTLEVEDGEIVSLEHSIYE